MHAFVRRKQDCRETRIPLPQNAPLQLRPHHAYHSLERYLIVGVVAPPLVTSKRP